MLQPCKISTICWTFPYLLHIFRRNFRGNMRKCAEALREAENIPKRIPFGEPPASTADSGFVSCTPTMRPCRENQTRNDETGPRRQSRRKKVPMLYF